MPTTTMTEKPPYLGLLNAISLAESEAGVYLEAWANATDDEELAGLIEPSYPGQMSMSVRSCLQIVLNEELAHRLYAERDLQALASR